jgi:hypothetical protein
METLKGWYKFRHNDSDAGLTEMIAGILQKPLPPEPTPLTTLPVSAEGTTTPAATGVTTAAGATTKPAVTPANGTPKPATTTTTTTTTNSAATTKPAAPKPSPDPKPKPKRNH